MIASLLPGLRDVRAPLVAGSLLLFGVVLLVGSELDSLSVAAERSERLNELVAWLGKPGLTTAALLGSYLLGSLVVSSIRGLFRQIEKSVVAYRADEGDPTGDRDINLSAVARRLIEMSKTTRGSIRHDAWFPFEAASLASLGVEVARWVPVDPAHATGASRTPAAPLSESGPVTSILTESLGDGGRRLRLASADLHSDFDRLRSEAELRDSLLPSLPVALVAILLNTSLSVAVELTVIALAALLLAVLFVQARQLDRASGSLLVGAIADHTISVPTLDRYSWKK